MKESWEGWGWRQAGGLGMVLGGSLACAGGGALLAAPEPTALTKVGGYGAIVAGGDVVFNGAGQMWSRKGGVSVVRELAGLYGRTIAGAEGEAQSRYWIGWSLFLFDLAGGAGATKIGNVPLRQLPTTTKAALQDVFLAIRGKNNAAIEQLEGTVSFDKIHASHNIEDAYVHTVIDDNSKILNFGERGDLHGPTVWDLKGKKIIDGKPQIGEIVHGNILHSYFGENLPHTFKTFDIYDAVTRKATSIKSLDINLSSYQTGNTLSNRIKEIIDDIADFQEYSMKPHGSVVPIELSASNIEERVLHLIIPYGTTNAQRQILQQMKNYAASKNVTFKLTEMF
jgi:hypothetical protein